MTVKVSANLSDEVFEALRDLAKRRNVTMTEVLRQAISLEKKIQDEIDAGSKILIEDRDNNIQRVFFR